MNELNLNLDSKAGQPMFEQLYRQIKAEITQGRMHPGEKLPSKRRLALDLQCSQNTIQAAYDQLVDEGYIEARPRSGYYAASLDGLMTQGKPPGIIFDQPKSEPDYRFDFTPLGVDPDTFPFAHWRRLTRDVISENDPDLLRAGHPQGMEQLRGGIAHYLYHSRGVRCDPEQIIISSGTEFLLQLLIQLMDETVEYAIENPGYEKLAMIFSANRVRAHAVPLDDQGMLPEELAACGAAVACITPSHQFPTGRIMPVSRRIQLLNWAYEAPGRYIVEDDYDSEFRYGGKPIPSLQSLDRQDRVIYLGAFSKSLSPALRVSYMVLPPELIRTYRERLGFYQCPVPVAQQKVLHRFMAEGHFERHLNRVRTLYRQKRERLVRALRNALPESEIHGDSAGLHLTLSIKSESSERELIESARTHQLKLYGLSRFYSKLPEPQAHITLVLGFATLKLGEISRAVDRLKQVLSQ